MAFDFVAMVVEVNRNALSPTTVVLLCTRVQFLWQKKSNRNKIVQSRPAVFPAAKYHVRCQPWRLQSNISRPPLLCFRQTASANNRQNFIENPETIRARQEARRKQLQEERERKHTRRKPPKQQRPPTEGSERDARRKEQTIQHKRKEAHKASKANHNRKKLATRKAAQGMWFSISCMFFCSERLRFRCAFSNCVSCDKPAISQHGLLTYLLPSSRHCCQLWQNLPY